MVDSQSFTDNSARHQRHNIQLVCTGRLIQGGSKSEQPGAYVDVGSPTLQGFTPM